jgi:hypothetical protein
MSAQLHTALGNPIREHALEGLAAHARAHLARPIRHRTPGTLWERAGHTMSQWGERGRHTMTPDTVAMNERFVTAERLELVARHEPERLRNLIHAGNWQRVRPVLEWMLKERLDLAGTVPAPYMRATLRRWTLRQGNAA